MASDGLRTLGDVVGLIRGTTYKSALLGQPGPILLGLASIQRNGGFRSDSLKTYGGESKEKLLLRPGDLFVSLKDVTQAADLLGAIARVPHEVELGRLTQDTVKLDFKVDSYPRDLVYWTLRSPHFRSYCRAHGTGTTNLGLPREDFLSYALPEPTEDLLSLVGLLEAIESRIALLGTTNATLEAIAQTLFKSWFVDFDPVRAKAEGREPESMDPATAALFPSEFEDSELGPLPKGWTVAELGKHCDNIRTQAKPASLDASTPYIGLEHMPRKSIALSEWDSAEGLASGKFWYQPGDVLFGKLRPYFHKVGIASHKGVCSTDILVIRATSPEWFGFTAMHLSSEALVSYATQLSNGAKMPRTNWRDLAEYKVAMPTEKCASAFNELAAPMIGRIHANIEAMCTLAELRDTLLPRLISGKLRLPEASAAVEEVLA